MRKYFLIASYVVEAERYFILFDQPVGLFGTVMFSEKHLPHAQHETIQSAYFIFSAAFYYTLHEQ